MREYATPLTITLTPGENLADDIVRHATETPDRILLSRRLEDEWANVTASEFHGDVRAVAAGLIANGIGIGDRVALMARTRFEWTMIDYAIWYSGAVTVPIY